MRDVLGARDDLKGLGQNAALGSMVKKLYADKTTPIRDICKSFNISRMTLWRYVKAHA